ncbi:nucleoside deaminase [Comamonas aquatica]|jgi:tRNA(Arg) A34 adenosine deaminase TadA|uniref:Nucleoside deaminase n=1 Tax=Comamonas aquatica TaxID=225991 RepID=A0AA42HSZ8_9BURK|nr:nucleoside deaminase [Comamonas aquatica]MDH0363733.1 nucleoside deaminase [Comamonas aquatica]MDH0383187.1 nucleoside deaminase [Comamonas aquatica]MDH0431218.1 nucleoside deaminase [Comamonas aquatica]MDH0494207.1 nucleoside deaminase [Comamonas aquatica]MDH0942244.1 nucleoside deaminase [Comamonas aquatica]
MTAVTAPSVATFPAEQPVAERDATYLRQAIALSRTARQRGNRPFGSVIVAPDGTVLGAGWNSNGESGDCTAHAEVQAIREACQRHDRTALEQATLYASGEPCVMCAGAIFWANIRRVVYGIDDQRLRVFRGERLDQRDVELSCRDVFRAAPFAVECTGPSLVDEASQPHVGAWK